MKLDKNVIAVVRLNSLTSEQRTFLVKSMFGFKFDMVYDGDESYAVFKNEGWKETNESNAVI